ncbi:SDR family NAD(P)-dependent oxidoreductase [Shigella flexneri]
MCKWVIFITGGGSGLGLALVERFIEEGAKSPTLELSGGKVASLRQRFREHGSAVEGNVPATPTISARWNNSLTPSAGGMVFIRQRRIWDYNASLVNTPADSLESGFHELFNVNVVGYCWEPKPAPRRIASQGSMIFTLSNAAWYPGGGGPLYTASKHAASGLIRSFATSWRRKFVLTVSVPAAWPPTCEGRRSRAKRYIHYAVTDAGKNRCHSAATVSPEPADFAGRI